MTAYAPINPPVLAWRFTRDGEPMPDWLFDLHEKNQVRFDRWSSDDPIITICGRFVLTARLGDWIVLLPTGGVQVWSDAMFQTSFKRVEPA